MITWNIDLENYTRLELMRLVDVVYNLDASIGNQIYEHIESKYGKNTCEHEWRVDTFDHFGSPVERYCEKCDMKEGL
jgi:hypothetical protein